MGRPKINRIVRNLPVENLYIPKKLPINEIPVPIENLTIVEFEALRLKHYDGFNQINCAKKMSISQSTFSRILESAHRKLTIALVEGKGIHVDGGTFGIKELFLGYGCLDCYHEWRIATPENIDEDQLDETILEQILPLSDKIECPNCNSTNIYRLKRNIIKIK